MIERYLVCLGIFLLTETIYWINDLKDFDATLKMVDSSNVAHFVDYRFWHESDDINRGICDRVYFFNSQDYRGIVAPRLPFHDKIFHRQNPLEKIGG